MHSLSVDVVIPVRNGAKTIKKTLLSVLSQIDLPNRIIVVDDGSTDNTVALVSGIGSQLIEVIKTAPIGVSHARNTGVRASNADLVAFLDADDCWHPSKLRLQIQCLAANPNAAVAYCGDIFRSPSGQISKQRRPVLQGQIFLQVLAGGNAGHSSNIVVRRRALNRICSYDEALDFGEDRDLILRLARSYTFVYCPEFLTYIFENPESVTRRPVDEGRAAKQILHELSVYEKWIRNVPIPFSIVQSYRKRIISCAIRQKYGLRWLLDVRKELHLRSPVMLRKLWCNHVTFSAWITVAALAFVGRQLLATTWIQNHTISNPKLPTLRNIFQ